MTTNSLRMQTKLGQHHESVKTFKDGNPIRECFYKKLKVDRVKTHNEFLFNEKYKDTFKGEVKNDLLKDLLKKSLKTLRDRGYHII